ncbi:PREDICTED: cyclin-A1 [Ceratosolen solmsi marchali]|uniref:Cyclin-A2 n=1 Tax=Ceratosolen solmsi marchali TaxID=326594 RepID=A0AAJ6YND0_9HYME|nr:PREDICTED: cyclin-A1 [Ceratosolen solmsi marchali]
MATMRVHEDQENRRVGLKENVIAVGQQQPQQQNKRAVLGVLSNNFVRNAKPEICKDEKYSKAKTNFVPPIVEPFTIYEEKKEEPTFQIYEDKLQTESSIVLRDSQESKKIEVKQITEFKVTVEKEKPTLEFNPAIKNVVESYRPVLQDVEEIKQKDVIIPKDSPISSDRSVILIKSEKKDLRTKRDVCKIGRANFYDVDEYRSDIYNYFKSIEVLHRPKPGYMKKQPDINYSMRTILVDWLVEVAEEYHLHTETLYLAVSYIDRFLSYMSVVRAKLQLVGTAAMFIAAKYEEIYPPEVSEFVYITDDTYTKKQVIRMEHLILRVLSFDLIIPTPLAFLMEYCLSNNLSEKTQYLAMYLCELSLLEADPYLQYLPSHLAASAIALARHTLREEVWPHEFELSSGYSFQDLKVCITCLHKSFKNAPNLSQQAIQEKYKTKKYGHVALLLPRSSEPFECEDSESA